MTTQIPLQFWAVGLIRISLSLAVLHLQLCVGLLFLCHIPYRFQVKACRVFRVIFCGSLLDILYSLAPLSGESAPLSGESEV